MKSKILKNTSNKKNPNVFVRANKKRGEGPEGPEPRLPALSRSRTAVQKARSRGTGIGQRHSKIKIATISSLPGISKQPTYTYSLTWTSMLLL